MEVPAEMNAHGQSPKAMSAKKSGPLSYSDMGCYSGDKDESGLPHGVGRYVFPDGKGWYKGEWRNGLPHGNGVHMYANGTKYTGEMKGGLRDGQGTYCFLDGGLYCGEYKANAMHGFGTFKWPDGRLFVGAFENDSYHGFGSIRDIDASGKFFIMMGTFNRGQLVESFVPPTILKAMSYILTWDYFNLRELKDSVLQHFAIPDGFANFKHYCEIFERLWVEEVYNELVEEYSFAIGGREAPCHWILESCYRHPKQKYFYDATFESPAGAGYVSLAIDDLVLVMHGVSDDGTHALARVVEVNAQHVKVWLFLTPKADRPASMLRMLSNKEARWKITRITSLVTALREYEALSNAWTFPYWQTIMTGKPSAVRRGLRKAAEVPLKMREEGSFNESQLTAIEHATSPAGGIQLLQGPPGTGKTTTIMGVLSVLLSRERKGEKRRILVCAPSNAAVDEIIRRLLKKGLRNWMGMGKAMLKPNIVRMGRGSKVSPDVVEFTLDNLQHSLNLNRRQIVERANIVFATLSGAASMTLSSLTFDTVIIDEAAQAIELSTLVPMQYSPARIVLVGDPKQLGATVTSRVARDFKYSQSLFSRLQNAGHGVALLDTQYRMHPEISFFPRNTFYEGKVKDGGSKDAFVKSYNSSETLRPYQIVHVPSIEERNRGNGGSEKSIFNTSEAEFVVELYRRLKAFESKETEEQSIRKNNREKMSVAVIAMYSAQVFVLRRLFAASGYHDVVINTVDAFQGQEMDVVIVSCVRASSASGIGFLCDTLRMNVALTRAKYALYVVGNAPTLCADPTWKALIVDAHKRGVLVDTSMKVVNFDPTVEDVPPTVRFGQPADCVLPSRSVRGWTSAPNIAMINPARGPAARHCSELNVDLTPSMPTPLPSAPTLGAPHLSAWAAEATTAESIGEALVTGKKRKPPPFDPPPPVSTAVSQRSPNEPPRKSRRVEKR